MDYSKLPRFLIYKERFSLKDFSVYDYHHINSQFAEVMLQLDIMKGECIENKVLSIFNNAYYITTMVLLEDDPRWRNAIYQKIAENNEPQYKDVFSHLTLSLVSIYLRGLSNELTKLQKAYSTILYDNTSKSYMSFKYPFDKWFLMKVILSKKDFSPRIIDKEVLSKLLQVKYKWNICTDSYNEQKVREIIQGLGETIPEKLAILSDIDDDAQSFYDKQEFQYHDVVKVMIEKIREELHEDYLNQNKEALQAKNKTDNLRTVIGDLQETEKLDYLDTSKRHRALLYKDRKDIDEFPVDDKSTVEYKFFESLFDRPFMKSNVKAPEYALKIFNNAYFICTLILMENHPRQFFNTYLAIASENHKDIIWENHIMPTTMALVYSLLISHNFLSPEDKLMKDIWENFQEWDTKGAPEGKDDFYSQLITSITFYNYNFGDYEKFESRSMVDLLSDTMLPDTFILKNFNFIISCMFGFGEEHSALPLLRQRIANIPNLDKTVTDYVDNKMEEAYQHAGLEWVSPFITKENVTTEIEESKDIEYPFESELYDNSIQQLDEYQNTINEKNQKITELEGDVKHWQALYEVADIQLTRYQEEEQSVEDLNEEQKLSIDESIIFVSALLGASLKTDVINQTQLAKLLEKITGYKSQSIRPRISALNNETQQVDDQVKEKFSEGTSTAAKSIYDLINKVVKGATIANKGYQCKQAMENINLTYHLGIKI